jgi:hypothetical protein
MVLAVGLKAHVISFLGTGGGVLPFSKEVLDGLSDAKSMFELAPDAFIDTARLPSSVVSLSTLVQYLKTIKDKLEKRDNATANKDWDVAKSGELRLYKLFACNIHALSDYITKGKPDFSLAPILFADAARMYGKANPPDGLSLKGRTMWEKTYGDGQPRTAASMKTLVYLCKFESGTPTDRPTPSPVTDNTSPDPETPDPIAPAEGEGKDGAGKEDDPKDTGENNEGGKTGADGEGQGDKTDGGKGGNPKLEVNDDDF